MESGGTKYLELALSRQRPWVRIGRATLVVVILIAPIVSGLIGYRFGYFDGTADEYGRLAPTTTQVFRMWTDQEVKSLGGVGMLVNVTCTYHQADGTVRVSDHPMGFDAATRYRC